MKKSKIIKFKLAKRVKLRGTVIQKLLRCNEATFGSLFRAVSRARLQIDETRGKLRVRSRRKTNFGRLLEQKQLFLQRSGNLKTRKFRRSLRQLRVSYLRSCTQRRISYHAHRSQYFFRKIGFLGLNCGLIKKFETVNQFIAHGHLKILEGTSLPWETDCVPDSRSVGLRYTSILRFGCPGRSPFRNMQFMPLNSFLMADSRLKATTLCAAMSFPNKLYFEDTFLKVNKLFRFRRF